MMQEFEKNQLDLEFQQKQLMSMSGFAETNKKQIAKEDIAQMKKNYLEMYLGLKNINWSQGMTLGMALQKALVQMDAFVASKLKVQNHPMGQELLKMHTEFRREMARHIMTSKHSEEKLQERHQQLYKERGEQSFKKASDSLNKVYDKYEPEVTTKKTPVMKSFEIAQQHTQQKIQQILWNQRQNVA